MPVLPATGTTILSAMLGKLNYATIAPTCYLGLSTATPSSDGSGFSEPGNGYARSLIGNYQTSATQKMTVTGNSATNSEIIFFNEATASWGTITHWGIFSAATGGTPLVWGALTTSVSVPGNYVPLFRVNNFTLTLE